MSHHCEIYRRLSGSILSLVQFLLPFVFVYDNECKTKKIKTEPRIKY